MTSTPADIALPEAVAEVSDPSLAAAPPTDEVPQLVTPENGLASTPGEVAVVTATAPAEAGPVDAPAGIGDSSLVGSTALAQPESPYDASAADGPSSTVGEAPVVTAAAPADAGPVPVAADAGTAAPDVGPTVQAAALRQLKAAAPAPPTSADIPSLVQVNDPHDVADLPHTATAAAAQNMIDSTLLALARTIRKPRQYVGYSAFLLFALHHKCQPCIWEGGVHINLLEAFAPWALAGAAKLHVVAIPCAVVSDASGIPSWAPISDEHPLHETRHFIAGASAPVTPIGDNTDAFTAFYTKLGVVHLPTLADGDCALDVMLMMLGRVTSLDARTQLREELSDYLMANLSCDWMQDMMSLCGELDKDDIDKARANGHPTSVPPPPEPSTVAGVAPPLPDLAAAPLDEATAEAMRWATGLELDEQIVRVTRALPDGVVREQIARYRQKKDLALMPKPAPAPQKISLQIGAGHKCGTRTAVRDEVCDRLHSAMAANSSTGDDKLPHGQVMEFMDQHIAVEPAKRRQAAQKISRWYSTWVQTRAALSVVADERPRADMDMLRSRHKVPDTRRLRNDGGGRRYNAPLVRQALYEWFIGLRYAIDWHALIASRQARGKKHLARFPRAVLIIKIRQLLEEHAYVCLLHGRPAETFSPDAWWWKRWEGEYGLCMRKANRKYEVPRRIQKERLELFLVSLFRIRKLIQLVFGYDALILNWDQSPFHHNETGSQDKPTLALRGDIVPVVQGNADAKKRWTAQLCTQSRFPAVAGDRAMPPAECMFKAEKDGPVRKRLQSFLRAREFPKWFTVTIAPKGSYREDDIIAFLRKHLEPWSEGRDWRIILADDFSAHKTTNVWNLCWSCGYVLLIHGGGCTPVGQTVDTDLNQHVRRLYGAKEAQLLLELMRSGATVPSLTQEQCMLLMYEVLSDPQLHMNAAKGYKKVGQSIELHGKEDQEICREAAKFWWEPTTDARHPHMRAKLNAELAALEREFTSGGLVWSKDDVRSLINPYPPRSVDKVLNNLGEDFYHDDVHALLPVDDAADADAHSSADESAAASDPDDASSDTTDDPGLLDEADIAPDAPPDTETASHACADTTNVLDADVAAETHRVHETLATLETARDELKKCGLLKSAHHLESETRLVKRQARALAKQTPAVAGAFMRLRAAEQACDLERSRAREQQRERKREAEKAIADRDAAITQLKKTRRMIQDLESTRSAAHALKTFTLAELGQGSATAGGAKARKHRFEVLDRLGRFRAGLSPGQRNDWAWFQKAWDDAMIAEHGANWAQKFSEMMQGVLDDDRSNAFSLLVHAETCRCFKGTTALHVPG